MELSRDSRIVQWAYLTSDGGVPRRTSLCAIFWRCVFTPVQLVTLLVLCVIASPVLLPMLAFAWWSERYMKRTGRKPFQKRGVAERVEASVLWQGAKAVKSKVCPIVEIK